jgi:hypothetical protein
MSTHVKTFSFIFHWISQNRRRKEKNQQKNAREHRFGRKQNEKHAAYPSRSMNHACFWEPRSMFCLIASKKQK